MGNSQSISMLTYGVDDTVLPIDPIEFSKTRSCHGFSAHLCGSQGGGEVRKQLVQREVAAALVNRRQIRRRATTAPTYSHIK